MTRELEEEWAEIGRDLMAARLHQSGDELAEEFHGIARSLNDEKELADAVERLDARLCEAEKLVEQLREVAEL